MKQIFYIASVALAVLLTASCAKKGSTPGENPYLIEVNYNNLTKGAEVEGEIVTLPVTASADGSELSLDFFNNLAFLSPGIYSVGNEVGKYQGHFKNATKDCAIKNGMITVTLSGTKNYSISGTVRLDDEVGTALKIRSKGVLEYKIPTYYYYTEEKVKQVNGIKADAHIYKIYDKTTFVQMAEVAVVGDELGGYPVEGTGKEKTAFYGSANAGCWFYDASYGTYVMLHGGVIVNSVFPDRLDFIFTDKFNFTNEPTVEFIYCEKKNDLKPVPMSGEDLAYYSLKGKMYSIESPLVEGMYELTVKLFFPDGREFQSLTMLSTTPNPALESPGSGIGFSFTKYEDCKDVDSNKAILPACFYRIGGVKYEIDDSEYVVLLNYQPGMILSAVINPATYGIPPAVSELMYGDIYSYLGFL